MAQLFDKPIISGVDRTLVLDPQEAFIYPFPFSDWNTVRVGMYFSFTTVENFNENIPDLTLSDIVYTSPNERIFFGLKHNTPNLPLTENEPFCGIASIAGSSYVLKHDGAYSGFSLGHMNGIWATERSNYVVAMYPNKTYTYFPKRSDSFTYWNLGYGYKYPQESGYASFLSFRCSVVNKGTSGQMIRLSYSTHNNEPNVSIESLKQNLLFGNYETYDFGYVPWTNSLVPMDLPSALIAYIPAPNIRMRIHTVGIIKEN